MTRLSAVKTAIPALLAIGLLCSSSCSPSAPPEQLIIGDWKVDSTYNYYNGFVRRQSGDGADWAVYSYANDGTIKEIKFGTHRMYHYSVSGDTLFWDAINEQRGVDFKILHLSPERLVLRKDKPPVIGSGKQERYEVRYFSRTTAPESTQLFKSSPRDSTDNSPNPENSVQ
jgi:hypothetical protein